MRAISQQLMAPQQLQRRQQRQQRGAVEGVGCCSAEGGDGDASLYFAYGSNMATAHTVAHCPSAVALGTALLPNFAIGFRRHSPGPQFLGGISTAEAAPGRSVEGVLFRVPVAELEAWDGDYAEDRYYRARVQLLPLSAAAAVRASDPWPLVTAEVYLPNPLEGPFAPAPEYVSLMVAGAREHGLHAHADHLEAVAAAATAAAAHDTGDAAGAGASGAASASAAGSLEVNLPPVVAELTDTFERYEQALDANDVDALDSFFWHSPHTTRLANGQHGYGFDAIHRHRAATRATGISGSSKGERVRVVVTTLGERFGTVMFEYLVRGSEGERTGRQSQTFVKFPAAAAAVGGEGGWKCVAAHVSSVETSAIVR
jgi:hypothetical protein